MAVGPEGSPSELLYHQLLLYLLLAEAQCLVTELYQVEQKPQMMVCTQAEVELSLMMLWQQHQTVAADRCVSLVLTGLMGMQEGLQ